MYFGGGKGQGACLGGDEVCVCVCVCMCLGRGEVYVHTYLYSRYIALCV